MVIYRLELTLLEKVFFASREIDELFQTEPVLGNYALTYALGLAVSPYRLSEREDRPYYREDLSALNAQGIYVTPATPLGNPSLEVERFRKRSCKVSSCVKSVGPVCIDISSKCRHRRAERSRILIGPINVLPLQPRWNGNTGVS